jgi:NAD(P)-dependent dehydrogenase (short-subunit alcohol dehydrogenase family)
MSRLEGKVALVTGATGGIGEAIAKRFAEEGASVMLVGRSPQKLEATRSRLDGHGRFAHFVADAVDEEATAGAVAATVEAFGGLDILVANAGTEGEVNMVEDQTVANFEEILRTNVVGVWLAMKHCIGPMKKRGAGSIIAMSSVAGLIGFPGLSAYAASKHAVYGLVKTAALELGESGIRVNAIGPGPIDNRMMQSLADQMAPDDPSQQRAGIESMVAMKRYGTNEEVANLSLFLASDEASYSTGGMFTVDGGYTAG